MSHTEQSLSQIVHTAAGQPADPDDLPLMEFQADPLQTAAGKIFRPQHDLFPVGRVEIAPIVIALDHPADHGLLDEALLKIFFGDIGDQLTVPQYR